MWGYGRARESDRDRADGVVLFDGFGDTGCQTSLMEVGPLLETFLFYRCRFVVVGSAARLLLGETVTPADLDIVVATGPDDRRNLVAALRYLHALVFDRHGLRHFGGAMSLPWEWGWSVVTALGDVDLIVRFIDDTTIAEHDADATDVTLASGAIVRCHATRWAA
jgi:hypothetical protein